MNTGAIQSLVARPSRVMRESLRAVSGFALGLYRLHEPRPSRGFVGRLRAGRQRVTKAKYLLGRSSCGGKDPT